MPENFSVTACQNCREQHLKCDGASPTCARCEERGRKCIRYRFRISKEKFGDGQRWLHIPKHLQFIRDPEASQEQDSESSFASIWDFEDPTADSLSISASPRRLEETRSPSDRFLQSDRSDHRSTESLAKQPLYLDSPIWPLQNPTEAILFRHFVHNLAIWLDLCDPFCHFASIVPQNAATCPILLNAIFALSARHLTHIGRGCPPGLDALASNRYHEACLSALIPMMTARPVNNPEGSDSSRTPPAAVTDENLFAATIILRVLEEMEASHEQIGMDAHGHLLGIHAFVSAVTSSPAAQSNGDQWQGMRFGTLWAACFWVGLRQEIYTAVMHQAHVQVNLKHAIVDRSLERSADPTVWANRAVVHCADVLNFCFGEGSSSNIGRWEELEEWNRRWDEEFPKEFGPIFVGNNDHGQPIKEVWYAHDSQVIGVQHHILATLFLVSFDPRAPKVGAQRKAVAERTTERIQQLVRRLCGVGIGNQSSPPGIFTACMGIAAFGDRFSDRADQEQMLDILRRTERDHARPTAAVQHQMMRTWEWTSD